MIVTWEAPTNNGGSPIIGYVIEKHDKEGVRWTKCNRDTVNELHFRVTGLLENHNYEFRVSAMNISGLGEASTPSIYYRALDPTFKPGPPNNPKVIDISSTSVVLAWGKPVCDGGCEIQGYIVEVSEATAEEQWKMCTPPTGVKQTKYEVVKLQEKHEYKFRVCAVSKAEYIFRVIAANEKGKSDPRTLAVPVQVKDLVIEPDVRPVFSSYAVPVDKDLKVEIPISGRPKPNITWTKDGSPLRQTTRVNVVDTEHFTMLNIKEATRDDSGIYGIVVSNTVGQKDATIEIITLDKPGPPTGPVKFNEISVESVKISWEPPKFTGGCPVSHYIVQKRDTTTTTWENVSTSVARSALKVPRLKTGAEYQFRVIAVNRYGKSYGLDSACVVAQYPYREPGPPGTPFVSSLSRNHMVVEWHEPVIDGGSSIIGYHLERKERNSILWTKINKSLIKETHFKTTPLEEGIEYEFRVYAENIVGIGRSSKISEGCVARDPCDPPGTPEVVTVSRDSITVQWTKPEYDGGSVITGYIVEKRDLPEGRWMKANFTNVIETQFTVTGLTEDAKYDFRVIAKNAAGTISKPSDNTGPITAKDEVDPPRFSVDPEFSQAIVVNAGETFKLDADIKGKPIPTAQWFKGDKEIENTLRFETTNSYTILTIDNVNRFDSGKYVLTLENNSGTKSAFVSVRILDSPSAPLNFVVKDITRDSVTLLWEQPLTDGGAKITNYIVEKRESVRKAYTAVTNNCTQNMFVISELQEGGIYYFRVRAVNEHGIGLAVETKDPVKVAQAPMPPGKVSVVDVTRNSVTLSWEKPSHDGGSKVICYNVEIQTKGSDKWNVSTTTKGLEATVTGLTSGEQHSFRIIAVNEKGKSEPKELGVPVITKDIQMEPTLNLLFTTYSVNAGKDLTIEVPFRGRPKPAVSWKKDGLPLRQTSSITLLTSEASSKISFKEATRDHVGKYEITLANTAGTKSVEIGVVVLDKPGSPTALKVDTVTSESITLSWNPPEYDGGCNINNYIVEKRDTITTVWETVSSAVARTSIKVSRLTHGSEYQFRVYAVNRYGKGPFVESSGITAQYQFKLPGPPATPQIAHVTKAFMFVTWNEPVNDGGSPVLGYHLERRERSSVLWIKMNRRLIKDTEFKVTGTEEGLFYEYRVYAENIAGIGKCSKTSELVAARDPCDPPGKPTITNITKTSVSLLWTKPEYDGGAKVTGYIVERRELPQGRWLRCNFTNIQETYLDVTGLTENQQYDFHVIAKNSAGLFSDPSDCTGPITAKDDVDPPRIMMDVKFRDVIVVKAGDALKIYADISGRPIPVVSWAKEGKEMEPSIDTSDTCTKLTIENATRFDSGKYTVTLQNPIGTAALTLAVKVLDSPGPPSQIKITDVTKDSVTVTWEAPENDGGDPIKNYHVEKREASKKAWVSVTNNCHTMSYKVEDLQEGAIYYFRIIGENEFGIGIPLETKDGMKITGQCLHLIYIINTWGVFFVFGFNC
uniref:Titin n=1 Tax=Paramormyrops kingsleyae TaxID=1676925 RepID=A0A3B3QGE6_9TELE